nr:uncharacterized protein LOC116283452 [Vicugna pacos]
MEKCVSLSTSILISSSNLSDAQKQRAQGLPAGSLPSVKRRLASQQPRHEVARVGPGARPHRGRRVRGGRGTHPKSSHPAKAGTRSSLRARPEEGHWGFSQGWQPCGHGGEAPGHVHSSPGMACGSPAASPRLAERCRLAACARSSLQSGLVAAPLAPPWGAGFSCEKGRHSLTLIQPWAVLPEALPGNRWDWPSPAASAGRAGPVRWVGRFSALPCQGDGHSFLTKVSSGRWKQAFGELDHSGHSPSVPTVLGQPNSPTRTKMGPGLQMEVTARAKLLPNSCPSAGGREAGRGLRARSACGTHHVWPPPRARATSAEGASPQLLS